MRLARVLFTFEKNTGRTDRWTGALWEKPGHFETSNNSLFHEQGSERSERASEQLSGASKRANRRVSGPVLTSRFLFDPDHSASDGQTRPPIEM